MFQYTPSTTCESSSTLSAAPAGAFFDLPPHQTVYASSPCCASGISAGLAFAPINSVDLHSYAMANAYQSLTVHEIQELGRMLASPFDASAGWGYLDELDHALWVRDSTSSSASSSFSVASMTSTTPVVPSRRAATRRSRPRIRLMTSPEESARRHAHRRSLQKGYEKDYRQRKRERREALRTEWLQLEYQLKRELLAAQNRAVERIDVASATGRERKLTEELQSECAALRTEHTLLTCKLATETRLREAREFFNQPAMCEKINALATTPSVMQLEFTW